MKLIPIFVDDTSGEGLYSMSYQNGDNEYDRLFRNWLNTNYVWSYLLANEEYLQSDYFDYMRLPHLPNYIIQEAADYEPLFRQHVEGSNLQNMFRPLDDNEAQVMNLQKTKSKINFAIDYRRPNLRIYSIRINANTFLVTGGVIKLTHFMEHHADTRLELEKFETTKQFLQDYDINNELYFFQSIL